MIQLLVEGGMNLFRAIRAVIPPAWQNIQILDPDIRAFHEYNSMHVEHGMDRQALPLQIKDMR